jgi:DNA-binding GntR family transcriptional regulator
MGGQSEDEGHAGALIASCAEIVRDLLRALAANDPSVPLASVSQAATSLQQHFHHAAFRANWHSVMEGVVERLNSYQSHRHIDHEYFVIARAGMKYLAELTTSDGFSAARISKARSELDRAVKFLQVTKERRQGDWTD